ncbi:MAG: SMC-Scp complex subunit ScpB [Akkermansiaceae bacterium]|nr:SMC-Scp complex subunit ScpB [Akkermansiaceae bacterium]
MQLSAIIEALLIASEDPLPSSEIARLIRARIAEAEDALAAAAEDKDENEGEEEPADRQPLERPQLPDELAALANVNDDAITAAIAELNHSYETTGRAFLCTERAKGWKIYTRPDYAEFVRQLFPGRKPSRLSGPAMETLAIIAYRQPVTKASLEAVRGVSCDGMIQKLLDRELIKIGGRADLPGRPMLYETTDLFFEHFGVKSVDELPNASELRSVKLPEPEDFAESPEDTEETDTPETEADDSDSFTQEDIEKQLALTAAGIPKSEVETTPDADAGGEAPGESSGSSNEEEE